MLETPTLVEEPRADETSAFTLCPEQANTRLWFFSLFSAMKQKFQYTRVKTPPSFRRRPDKPSLGLLSAGPPQVFRIHFEILLCTSKTHLGLAPSYVAEILTP